MTAANAHPLLGELLSFGLGLALFLAVAVAFRSKEKVHYAPAFLLLFIGLGFLPSLLHIRAGLEGNTLLRGLGHVGAMFIGPAYIIYIRHMSGFSGTLKKSVVFLFGVFVGLAGLAALLVEPPVRHRIVLAVATFFLGLSLIYLRRGRTEERPMFYPLVLTVCGLIATGVIFVGLETGDHSIAHGGVGFLAVLVAGHGFLLIKLPGQLKGISAQAKRTDYLHGRDTGALLKRLNAHMDEQKPYLDEDLDLRRLAAELGLTAHQLSQLLNDKLNTNFYTFIGRYRTEEAKQLLLAEPDRTVLSVSQAAGFNSKSAFHNAFLRHTGTNPTEYRRKNA